jgi:hypothetical protein
MNLPQIPHDKANHIVYGWAIYYVAIIFIAIICLFFELSDFLINYTPLAIAMVFGLYKEFRDEKKYKGFDVLDLLDTIAIPFLSTLKDVSL